MTVWAWVDYAYYDGLLCFARGVSTVEGVTWMGQSLPVAKVTV